MLLSDKLGHGPSAHLALGDFSVLGGHYPKQPSERRADLTFERPALAVDLAQAAVTDGMALNVQVMKQVSPGHSFG
jgi:hypothetical protein